MTISAESDHTPTHIVAALLAAFAAVFASPCAAQPAWKPDRPVEIVVVVNKVGGGGAVAYAYTNQRPGDAHTIALARTGLLSNHILGRSPLNYTDMTPLAMMGSEAMSLVVRADSPINRDLLVELGMAK